MSRIRSIKPEFFTSEDIVSVTPLARLFFIALWCEADREGRLDWKPGTFKIRYFPADNISIEELGAALANQGLINLYKVGDKQYAEIPTFKEHQVINNREAESLIPARVKGASARVKVKTDDDVSDCPHHELIDLFVKNLPMLPKPVKSLWGGTNSDNLRARWTWVLTEKRESGERYATNEAEALAWFDRFFVYVSESDFLTGKNGKWTSCDLGWLLVKSNFTKVVQGTYVNKAA